MARCVCVLLSARNFHKPQAAQGNLVRSFHARKKPPAPKRAQGASSTLRRPLLPAFRLPPSLSSARPRAAPSIELAGSYVAKEREGKGKGLDEGATPTTRRHTNYPSLLSHTIVLMQSTSNLATRTFLDYETVPLAMDGVCQMFERRLKELNPNMRNITYDITDLYNFIDQLADMSALVYSRELNAYLPYNKEWIKKRTFMHLRKQAQ